MTPDAEKLYALLPAVYRLRDHGQGGPLKELIAVLAEQIAVVQEGIDQAYDDLFIETCAEWVVPYIGDLIGARLVHSGAGTALSQRAQVANTLGHRRRKGTLAMLEQLARDVTEYPAVAVEFFSLLATTQYMNHPRPANVVTVDVRRRLALERIGSAFDRNAHTFEARRIASGRGRYNIPNVGIFLFRLDSFQLPFANAARLDDRRYLFNPLGIDAPLFNRPQTEKSVTQLAEPVNAPMPLARLAMEKNKELYYPASVFLKIAVNDIDPKEIAICNLSDKPDGSGDWAHLSKDKYAIDPALGRLALPQDKPAPNSDEVLVLFHYGFNDEIGGGGYERPADPDYPFTDLISGGSGLQARLGALHENEPPGGVLQVADSRTYPLTSAIPNLQVDAGSRVEVRSQNGHRPLIEMQGGSFIIHAGAKADIILDGLMISGGAVRVTGQPRSVTISDCTLVPGISRTRGNEPLQPGAPSLIIESDSVEVTIRRSILGGLALANGSPATIEHSILDATAPALYALADPGFDGSKPGGSLKIANSTIIGCVNAQRLDASNCIFIASAPGGAAGGLPPIRAERTQAGCVRFCYLPLQSRAPRRFQCHPVSQDEEQRVLPLFTSLRFGHPGYCQLSPLCPPEISRGADDESEMGVFHDRYQQQRETNLRIKLDEYLRFGLEAGIIYAS